MFFFRQRDFMWLEDLGGYACLAAVFALIAFIAFLSAMSRVLGRVEPENRRMEPGQVWLNLIPILNVVWMPVTVERVGESIRGELIARGRNRKRDGYGKTAGLTAIVLLATGIFPMVPFVTYPFALIYGIVYWAQLGSYARRLRDQGADYTPAGDEGW